MDKEQIEGAKRLAEELLNNGLKVGEGEYLIASASEAQLSAALLYQSQELERLRGLVNQANIKFQEIRYRLKDEEHEALIDIICHDWLQKHLDLMERKDEQD